VVGLDVLVAFHLESGDGHVGLGQFGLGGYTSFLEWELRGAAHN
jgi:hypothetical protein